MDTRSLPVPGPDPHPVHGASRAFREGLPPEARRQYDLLAARLAHALDAGIGCDERLMRLPHPGRIAAHGALHAQAELFRAFAPTAWAAARNPGCLRSAIAGLLATQHPGFAHAFCRSDREAMMDAALWLMVAAGRIHCLQTTDALEERLRRTDFGRDVPGAFFRLPFPAVFLEFGARRDFPVTLMHAESGGHVVEGVYLLEGQMLPSLTAPAREPVRGFDVIVFGSAMGRVASSTTSSSTWRCP